MGLQLGAYESDTDSDAGSGKSVTTRSPSSQSLPVARNRIGGTGKESLAGKTPQGRVKQPIKIGSKHPLLGKSSLLSEGSDDDHAQSLSSSSNKRTRPLGSSSTQSGRSGLVDLLPPPKKKAKTVSKPTVIPKDVVDSRSATSRVDLQLHSANDKAVDDLALKVDNRKKRNEMDLFGLSE